VPNIKGEARINGGRNFTQLDTLIVNCSWYLLDYDSIIILIGLQQTCQQTAIYYAYNFLRQFFPTGLCAFSPCLDACYLALPASTTKDLHCYIMS